MAKSSIQCATCNGSITVRGDSRADAVRLAKWHEKKGAICSVCLDKQRASESRLNADANRAAGLPILLGSEKQVAWAETLRAKLLQRIEYTRVALIYRERGLGAVGEERDQVQVERAAWHATLPAPWNTSTSLHYGAADCANAGVESWMFGQLVDTARRQRTASWWIEHQSSSVPALLQHLIAQIEADETATPETDQLAAEALSEALLKPGVEPVSQLIVDISYARNELRIEYPEKREDFRLTMRALGYTWAKTHWSRRLSEFTGTAEDRMAEAAMRVLTLGLMVRLHDEVARAKVQVGDFLPEQRRWVTRVASGEFAKWLTICWGRDDDFYEVARSLPGSRHKSGSVYFPAGTVSAVVDFAERYGFSVCAATQKLLDEHRAAIGSGSVVTTLYQAPEPVRVEHTGVPSKLVVEATVIDEELRDD